MNTETRTCQNCNKDFAIESEDFQFYEKINVPAPTFCSVCRSQRRLAFVNLFNLYKRKCDLCGEIKISMYPPDAPYKVYCLPCWWSDNWDPLEYGRDCDFNKPFFEQINELWHEVPLVGLSGDLSSAELAPYNNYSGHLKNCYLLFFTDVDEDCAYGFYVTHSKSVIDSSLIRFSEYCYDNLNSLKNNRCIGVRNVIESLDCAFMRDSRNCKDCFASANLRNKQYHIFNKSYTKEEYKKEIKKWDLGSYTTYQEAWKKTKEHWRQFPPKPRYEDLSTNVTGNYVYQSKNCKECYEVSGTENSKFISMITEGPVRDCYDVSGWGNNLELAYEGSIVGEDTSRIRFCHDSGLGSTNVEYCKLSFGAANQFGCASVRKSEYCILNKQYDKKSFEELRIKIIKHMDKQPYTDRNGRVYRYGEFFPTELSSCGYNESIAQSFFPLSKKEVIENGYNYQEQKKGEYSSTKKASELPDHIKDAKDDIINEVVECGECTKGFKIFQMELDFLRRMNLPLPRRCPFCRIQEKYNEWVKQLTLTTRMCSKCQTKVETPYTKEEYENVLCLKCYNEAVI